MAYKLIGETQRAIFYPCVAQYDCILLRRAADQPHVAQRALIAEEAEGSGGSDLSLVGIARQIEIKALQSYGTWEVDGVGDGIALGGING